MRYRCASFFAGVGGIELGFDHSIFEFVYANEFDKQAVRTYEANSGLTVDIRDIRDVPAESIPDFDIMVAGFPCQPFSVAGNLEGFSDRKGRGNLFFELVRIMRDKKPKIVFLENVSNLEKHDGGNTFKVIKDSLESLGYFVKHAVLNAKDYGNLPQNRERIYIVAFDSAKMYNGFEFPNPIPLTETLSKFIYFDKKVPDRYYYTKDKYEIYEKIFSGMEDPNSIYQWRRVYVRENKSGVCPTLTANMGGGGHNVPLIISQHSAEKIIRKLTPRECFNLQGFPESFRLPDMANTHLYKQAGNSVAVPVIRRIANRIVLAIPIKSYFT